MKSHTFRTHLGAVHVWLLERRISLIIDEMQYRPESERRKSPRFTSTTCTCEVDEDNLRELCWSEWSGGQE